MQNSQTIKTGNFVALFILIIFIPINTFSAVQQVNNWLDEPVTIRFQNEPLSKMLEKISKQTGIAILYDQELANEKVSGNYKDVKASDAITRLFIGKNKSIQVSNDKKVVVVKTFGAKDFIWAGSPEGAPGIDNDSGVITLAELHNLHLQHFKKYKERIADDNEIIEGGENPMTRGEIRAMHEQHYKAYKERLANDDVVISVSGDGASMTRGQLRVMHEQRYKAYKERLADDDVISVSGDGASMTRGQLSAMQYKLYNTYKERLANDNEIIEGGENPMTRGEIRAMHEKEEKEYKESQKDRSRIVD